MEKYIFFYIPAKAEHLDGFRPFLRQEQVLLFMAAGSGQVGKETFYSRSVFFRALEQTTLPAPESGEIAEIFAFPLWFHIRVLSTDWRVFF